MSNADAMPIVEHLRWLADRIEAGEAYTAALFWVQLPQMARPPFVEEGCPVAHTPSITQIQETDLAFAEAVFAEAARLVRVTSRKQRGS